MTRERQLEREREEREEEERREKRRLERLARQARREEEGSSSDPSPSNSVPVSAETSAATTPRKMKSKIVVTSSPAPTATFFWKTGPSTVLVSGEFTEWKDQFSLEKQDVLVLFSF